MKTEKFRMLKTLHMRLRRAMAIIIALGLLLGSVAFTYDFVHAEEDAYVNGDDTAAAFNFEGIMPLDIFGEGHYPLFRNVELHFAIGTDEYPNYMLMGVTPGNSSVQIVESHGFPVPSGSGGPGLPSRAGFTLEDWAGERDSATFPVGGVGDNLRPSPVSITQNNPSINPTTAWMAANAPNTLYYPMFLFLGENLDMTGWTRAIFFPIQLGSDDMILNIDNRQALSVSPLPPPQNLTRAVVGTYDATDFITDAKVATLLENVVGPLEFILPENGPFVFAPGPGITVRNDHHVSSDYIVPSFDASWEIYDHYATIPIVPAHDNLGAGTHRVRINIHQVGYEYEYIGNGTFHFEPHDLNDPLLLSGDSFLNLAHRNHFYVDFVVMRPATSVAITDPRDTSTRSANINFANYPITGAAANNTIYSTAGANANFVNTVYTNPSDTRPSHERDITVTLSITNCRYSFFDYDASGDAIYNNAALSVTPPSGYTVVSSKVVNGQLVVVLRPIPGHWTPPITSPPQPTPTPEPEPPSGNANIQPPTPSPTPTPTPTPTPDAPVERVTNTMIGYRDETMRPHDNITRAHVTTMFFRLLPDNIRAMYWSTTNDFSDVTANRWFNNAISTMHEKGFIGGYPDGTFRPNDYMTFAEILTLAARFYDLNLSGPLTYFANNHWAQRYINAVAAMGWIEIDAQFDPNAPISRAQTAMLFNTMTNRFPVNYRDFMNQVRTWIDVKNHEAWYYLHVMIATNSFYVIYDEDGREIWIAIADDIDWSVLERTTSEPWHLSR